MSKAFDIIDRRILFEHLEEILNQDEMHVIGILFFLSNLKKLQPGGGYLTREVTGVCGKALHTLYPVA